VLVAGAESIKGAEMKSVCNMTPGRQQGKECWKKAPVFLSADVAD
jgi:hypothetical protein